MTFINLIYRERSQVEEKKDKRKDKRKGIRVENIYTHLTISNAACSYTVL